MRWKNASRISLLSPWTFQKHKNTSMGGKTHGNSIEDVTGKHDTQVNAFKISLEWLHHGKSRGHDITALPQEQRDANSNTTDNDGHDREMGHVSSASEEQVRVESRATSRGNRTTMAQKRAGRAQRNRTSLVDVHGDDDGVTVEAGNCLSLSLSLYLSLCVVFFSCVYV